MRSRFVLKPSSLAAITVVLAGASASALGAGFQLNESSASGLGNAFAGGAAIAEDGSTLWSNVAGLSRIPQRQGVLVLHLITPSIKFSDGGSVRATQQPLGGNGGDAGGLNVVPGTYLVWPLGDGLTAGLGITAPWGLVTEYDNTWAGRFQATKSAIQTLNFNPGIAWKPSRDLSVGLGLNLQRILAEFNNQVNYSGVLLQAVVQAGNAPGSPTFNAVQAATAGLESSASVKGADTGLGWNIGVLWNLGDQHRIGVHYRSPIKFTIEGKATFVNPAVPALATALATQVNSAVLFNSTVSSDVELPAIVNLSYFGALNRQWDLMADAQWTEWSTIQTLTFVRGGGAVLQSTPEQFKDTWKLAVGANYKPGGDWMWRGGLALDQSPVRDALRTPRLPDSRRTWYSAGAQYRMSNRLKLDLGATYITSKKAPIDISVTPATPLGYAYGLLKGTYNSSTTIVSGQLTYMF
jgi:long-chain fatty acid transport protein